MDKKTIEILGLNKMENEKLKTLKISDKKLMELKNKHIEKFHYHKFQSDFHEKIIKEINEEQVNRLMKGVFKRK